MDPTAFATTVEVGDYTFDVTTAGPADGAPVLMLHGFPETAACWRPITPLLTAAGLRVIAPSQRGYSAGARPVGVEHYGIANLVGDAVGLLDTLGIESAHLVGHDWGAAVAWVVAAGHPDRVRTLTAVSVPHPAAFGWALREDEDQRQRSRYIGVFRHGDSAERALLADDAHRLRAVFGDVDPTQVAEHVRTLAEPGALTAALSWYRAMGREFGDIAPVTVPTTYVWSNGDEALGRAGAERCGEFVDAPYRFVELDGISHWIPEQAPGALADAVLARIEGNGK
ncbi:alpha/beta hydrolase [Rhodococcus spelaei]|uniref:Alpha/beta hydrolase n=1 Tax=Rhodococcus spelaei TaxID=2546320 RepID=A0A541BLW5_9NOCA|nr:alpha/beta hydrolase [Rhodococcus spelaei]TQF73330.1 alpha/beta hydrolase [Rhodococcus spelaei]